MREMIKMVMVLTIITAVSGGILSVLKTSTEEKIESQVLKFQKAPAIGAIFDTATNDPLKERFKIPTKVKDKDIEITFFPAVLEDGSKAVAFEAKGAGFGGDVGLMVGIDLETDKIIKARVTTHSETPGIGSRVKDDATYVSQFTGMGFDATFKLKNNGGDIDALSGATVTSKGVSVAAAQVKKLYLKLKPQILNKMK
ncbi:MAG: RnfABCDGE type electron transport complex subunit G [Desulfobacterales bacterium]|nr:RnfABCDGE type electron transport complex subunit G [Desulfobacterales bacterium]